MTAAVAVAELRPEPRTVEEIEATGPDAREHDWIGAAEVPLAATKVEGTMTRRTAKLQEGVWVRILEVYCSACRQPWDTAKGTECMGPDDITLRGGPIGTRRRAGTSATEGSDGLPSPT